ncbi:MAG: hypothetical protein JJU00_13330 [Opitutales bacterium]|nr:hypothetical protein [Opitutales bacterium]
MNWTTPNDLTRQVRRLWERGLVLQSVLSEEPVFPKRLTLKSPASHDLAHSFGEVREWCAALADVKHLRFEFREVRHRVTGTNRYPAEAWVDSAEDAVALLGKTRAWRQFQELVGETRVRRPELLGWIAKRPLVALAASDEWERYLDMVDWMKSFPQPGCYLRHVDLPGIDTKFIEAHRGLLSELFDLVLSPHCIDERFSGINGFCRRYGFREKPERIRFRILDRKFDPLHMGVHADVTLDFGTFSELPVSLKKMPETIFITENETNFLAFPKIDNSWILFGAGYGFAALSYAAWMTGCRIFYWGDIDTHGFAVLNELRRVFSLAESFLMDRETLHAHRAFWGSEPSPAVKSLTRLKPDEAVLYDDLKSNRIAPNLRLEQERIAFSSLVQVLSNLGFRPWVS